jgi:hypothetical protein
LKKLIGLGLVLLALLPAGVMAAGTCPYMGATCQYSCMSYANGDQICTPPLSLACQLVPTAQGDQVCQINGQICTAEMMKSCNFQSYNEQFNEIARFHLNRYGFVL